MAALSAPYSRARILTMLNPWADPDGAGYQLIQGFYAFGTGGLAGVGIGMSKQKYSYLPMAYNDFIFAVIGEELGLVGTLGVLAAFFALRLGGPSGSPATRPTSPAGSWPAAARRSS